MKAIGSLLLLAGLLGLFFALAMDTTVPTDQPERRIHNNGLMNNRIVYSVTAGFIALIGATFLANFSRTKPTGISRGSKKCPFCAELVQPEAIKCRYCGEAFKNKNEAILLEDEVKSLSNATG